MHEINEHGQHGFKDYCADLREKVASKLFNERTYGLAGKSLAKDDDIVFSCVCVCGF